MKFLIARFVRDRSALAGLLIIVFFILVAVFARQIAPYPDDLLEVHPLERLQPPSGEHLFGTDALGRDLCSRVVLGAELALEISVTIVLAASSIGVALGLVAGFHDGLLSGAIMRLTDLFLAVPQMVLALALTLAFRPSLQTAILALSITYWPHFCRTAYAETRRCRISPFIEATRMLGGSTPRVLFLHILPNIFSPILVRITIGMGYTILTAAMLGFLGVGVPPPSPEWGAAIAESRIHLPAAWWFAAFPGLAIFFLVLGFNLLGDGLRDVLDPRLRRAR